MRAISGFLIIFACLCSPAGAAEPLNSTLVFGVDLERAMLGTPEGQAARERLGAARLRKQKELDAWSRAIETKRAAAEKSNDAAQLKELEQEQQQLLQGLVEAQRGFVEEEEREVGRLVAGLRTIIDRLGGQQPGIRIVVASDVRFISLPSICDRTDWLIRAHITGAPEQLSDEPACRFLRFARIDMQRILDESRAGRAALARLKKEHQEMQTEVDRRTDKLKQLKAAGDQDGFLREVSKLDALFKSFQRQLKQQEDEARARLMADLSAKLRPATAAGTLFVAAGATLPEPLKSGCAATDWTLRTFDDSWGDQKPTAICPQAPAGDDSQ